MNTDIPSLPILVADDSATDVFFLQRRLKEAGIMNPLQHVENGSEAIRVLEARWGAVPAAGAEPWLLFLDLKMPLMDGFDVLEWMRRRGMTERTTTVVLTTSDEPSDVERTLRLGAYRFLVKYPQPEDLVEIVAQARERAAGVYGWRHSN